MLIKHLGEERVDDTEGNVTHRSLRILLCASAIPDNQLDRSDVRKAADRTKDTTTGKIVPL
jgi:hypothetical protein